MKLRIVTEQKSLCRNLMTLQRSNEWSHQQQRGLLLRRMSKGTHTRLVQMPVHARFLIKRLVTDLKAVMRHVDHSTMELPVAG